MSTGRYQSNLRDGYCNSSIGIIIRKPFQGPLNFPVALHNEPFYHILEFSIKILCSLCFRFFITTNSWGKHVYTVLCTTNPKKQLRCCLVQLWDRQRQCNWKPVISVTMQLKPPFGWLAYVTVSICLSSEHTCGITRGSRSLLRTRNRITPRVER